MGLSRREMLVSAGAVLAAPLVGSATDKTVPKVFFQSDIDLGHTPHTAGNVVIDGDNFHLRLPAHHEASPLESMRLAIRLGHFQYPRRTDDAERFGDLWACNVVSSFGYIDILLSGRYAESLYHGLPTVYGDAETILCGGVTKCRVVRAQLHTTDLGMLGCIRLVIL